MLDHIIMIFQNDGFVKSPTCALRCIPPHCDVLYVRSLLDRRIADSSEFARLEFGAFYFAIKI